MLLRGQVILDYELAVEFTARRMKAVPLIDEKVVHQRSGGWGDEGQPGEREAGIPRHRRGLYDVPINWPCEDANAAPS